MPDVLDHDAIAQTDRALRARGDDPQSLLADYVKVVNAAISGRPADMTVAIVVKAPAYTFTVQLVFGSNLARSTAYDAHIYEETSHLHPQGPRELNIGDGHFATCRRFFTPVAATGGRVLTPKEVTWNEWVQLVRSRVEHLNTVLKNHRMFKGEPYRGWVRNLKLFVRISLHGAAAEIRARTRRDGDRYAGFGPWPH